MELKQKLDTLSAQLQQGLRDRNVETCMAAIQELKALGANVTFSLAPEEQAPAAYEGYQADAGQYPEGQGYYHPQS